MSQITLQGKQQALMRVAASRVAVVDAVASTQRHVGSCVRALPVSPATIMRIGAAAGAAASVVGALAGLRRRRKAAEKAAAASQGVYGLAFQVIMQLLGPVLLPMLQRFIQKTTAGAQSGAGRDSVF